MIKIGDNKLEKRFIGNDEVQKVYIGNNLVY